MSVFDVLGTWGVTTALACGVLLLIYILNSRWINKVRRDGINGPRGVPVLGCIPEVLLKGVLQAENKWIKQYGDVFGWANGQLLNVIVKDPEILKEIFVKDFSHFTERTHLNNINGHPIMTKHVFSARGKAWKRIRAIVSPTFSTGKMKLMNDAINRCADRLSNLLEKNAITGEPINAKQFFGAYTMDVIASTAFGVEVESQTNPDEPFVAHAKALFEPRKGLMSIFMIGNIFPPIRALFNYLGMGFFSKNLVSFFVKEVTSMVKDRRLNPNINSDFLQLMMNAELEHVEENNDIISMNKKLSTEEIIASSILFFIAGYETTGTLLQYTSYEMARHPELQERMFKEMQEVLGEEEPGYDNVRNLTYMDQFLFEALRMYPPVNRLTRVASEDRVINGVNIRKEWRIIVPVMSIHYDPRFYPDPEEFRPERFADRATQNSVLFLPFGYGPRICLGMRLALMEAKIALVSIMRKMKFVTCSETQIPLKLMESPGLTRPSKPIMIKAELRR